MKCHTATLILKIFIAYIEKAEARFSMTDEGVLLLTTSSVIEVFWYVNPIDISH